MPDHLHLLITYHPHQSLPDLMQALKGSSSKWTNENNFLRGKFNWQEGYGAFSYSQSHLDNVIKYVNDQEKHHSIKSFRTEYIEILKKYQIPYNEKYIFHEAL